MKRVFIVLFLLISGISWGADMKVGIASRIITPKLPFWMTGFGTRTKPANEILHDVWAKALVFEESPNKRLIIVTTDILGLSHEISEAIANRVSKKYGINRSQLLINSSHTHSGPAVWPSLSMIFDFTPEDLKTIGNYNLKLTNDIVAVIDSALSHLTPMKVWSGHGSANFAINRRELTNNGYIIGKNPEGPVDHDVPVLKITTPEGQIKAILFGYACHNSTLNGYQFSGDYAGFAQLELQKFYPGATAFFMTGCAGDQNAYPRNTIELSEKHGRSLAEAVEKALSGNLLPVRAPIRTAYTTVNLEFCPFDLEKYEKDIQSDNKFEQRRAKLMLEGYNRGWDMSHYSYPMQVARFSKDFTILAMGGEVVVDYSLKTKKKYSKENLFVSGYCSEVMCYIPTKRVLEEGGYEAEKNLIYYGFPGPFTNTIEDRINKSIQKLMKQVGVSPSKRN